MAAKTVAIPSHITNAYDKTGYYNLVYDTGLGTISRSTDNMLVSDISTTVVRNVLAEDNNSVSDLCQSANINTYSYYKPASAGGWGLGELAGYNENAKPPTYFAGRPPNDPLIPVDVYIEPDGSDWKIHVDCILRRGEGIPTYTDSADDWADIDVTFSLRSLTGGGGGLELTSATVTGTSVTRMFSSTMVTAYFVDEGTFTVTNTDTDYRLQVHAYYGDGTTPIEDSSLYYYITAKEYVPATPPTYTLGVYEKVAGTPFPMPQTGSGYIPSIYCVSTSGYTGGIKVQFDYYPPDGSLTTWYGTCNSVWIEGDTDNSSATVVEVEDDGGTIGDIDTTKDRVVRFYYYGWSWVLFETYTIAGS